MSRRRCAARDCCASIYAEYRPFCTGHWQQLPGELRQAWVIRDRRQPQRALLMRLHAALYRAQFGKEMR